MKNSSKLELTIERNFTLSRRGFSGSCACCKTLLWNSNRLSSRLMYNSGEVSVRVCGPVAVVGPGVAIPVASASSSERSAPLGERSIEAVILLVFRRNIVNFARTEGVANELGRRQKTLSAGPPAPTPSSNQARFLDSQLLPPKALSVPVD